MPYYITDLQRIREIVEAEADENIRFRQFLAYRLPWSDRALDAQVAEIIQEVEAAIDCTACANCCRTLEISVDEEDMARMGVHLGYSAETVMAQYTAPGRQCPRALAPSPCPFLAGCRCGIYPARLRDCREFPHLHKGSFRTRMWQLLGYAEDCPIIFNVLRRLKQALQSIQGM